MNPLPVVLYAEDDANDAFFLELAFKKMHGTSPLHIVTQGEDAIAYLKGETPPYSDRRTYPFPDVCLLDLKLPLIPGLDVLKWIKLDNNCKSLPVAMLSSSGEPNDIKQALALGATHFITKPDSLDGYGRVMDTIMELYESTLPV